MIEGHDLDYVVSGVQTLHRVSIKAEAGEVVCVLGPNGAGKSTLFRLLSGEIAPRAGKVTLLGHDVTTTPKDTLATMRAVMPQESVLSFPFTAFEVVMLGRTPHASAGETMTDRAIARAAMAATDSLAYEDRTFSSLSGGERQRVTAARVLAQIWEGEEGRALLLDEPTSSLDLLHQHGLLETATTMAKKGCAVVCILHDLNLAARYATRVVVLQEGRKVAEGTPREVLTRALLADVFEVDARIFVPEGTEIPVVVPRGPLSKTKPPRLATGALL